MNAKAYTISNTDGERIAHACAWCFPGAKLVEAFPELAGLKISHGMCKPHLASFRAEMESTEQIRLAPAA